jgi:hypothetical protein
MRGPFGTTLADVATHATPRLGRARTVPRVGAGVRRPEAMRTTDPLGGWRELPADCLPVAWSEHAVEQFAERVRAMKPEAAARELRRMLPSAKVTTERPEHIAAHPGWRAYLVLGDLVCPLFANAWRLRTATILWPNTTQMHSPVRRDRVNASRQRGTAARRRIRSEKRGRSNRRPRIETDPPEDR